MLRAAACPATRIDAAALDAPGARLQTERISHLWELAVQQSGNPALGLAQHHVARPASFDVVGYTMMSCADLRGAFERLIRYMLILSDALTVTVNEELGGDRITFVLFGGDRPMPRQRIEFISISVISFCRWISRREICPRAVEFAYPAPSDPALYRDACRTAVGVVRRAPPQYSVRTGRYNGAAADVQSAACRELHERFAGDYLRQFDHAQTSYRVREVILRRLPDGEPRRDIKGGERNCA